MNFTDLSTRLRRKFDNWEGGGTYSYIHVLHNQFLLKSIVLLVCEYEYMNMCPPKMIKFSTPLYLDTCISDEDIGSFRISNISLSFFGGNVIYIFLKDTTKLPPTSLCFNTQRKCSFHSRVMYTVAVHQREQLNHIKK